MKRVVLMFIPALICGMIFTSCDSDNGDDPKEYDVYVAGYQFNREIGGTTRIIWDARLWKNGIATNLSNGTYSVLASSVYVSGNDVFVVGWKNNAQDINVATLWKNGVAQNIGNETLGARATSVFVVEKN